MKLGANVRTVLLIAVTSMILVMFQNSDIVVVGKRDNSYANQRAIGRASDSGGGGGGGGRGGGGGVPHTDGREVVVTARSKDACTANAIAAQNPNLTTPVVALAESHNELSGNQYKQALDSVLPDKAGACLAVELENMSQASTLSSDYQAFFAYAQASGMRVVAMDTAASYVEQGIGTAAYSNANLTPAVVNTRNLAMAGNINGLLNEGCSKVVTLNGYHHFDPSFGSAIQNMLPGLVTVVDLQPVEQSCP